MKKHSTKVAGAHISRFCRNFFQWVRFQNGILSFSPSLYWLRTGFPVHGFLTPISWVAYPPYNHHQPSITPYNHLNQPPQPSNICFTGRFIPLRLLPPEQNLPGFSHKLNLTGSHLGFGWKNRKNPQNIWKNTLLTSLWSVAIYSVY